MKPPLKNHVRFTRRISASPLLSRFFSHFFALSAHTCIRLAFSHSHSSVVLQLSGCGGWGGGGVKKPHRDDLLLY